MGITYLFFTIANTQASINAKTNKYQFLRYLFSTLLKSSPPVRPELAFPTAYNFVNVRTKTANDARDISTVNENVGVIPNDFAFIGSA